MNNQYLIAIDQSTQSTKAMLFDTQGQLLGRKDLPHRQKIDANGYVSHDPEEIYQNTIQATVGLLKSTGIDPGCLAGIGISNQRETSLIWDRQTGKPLADAVVWQCARAADICRHIAAKDIQDEILQKTGLRLSPYFPAAKFAWLLENVPQARQLSKQHRLCFGTIDTWLLYRLTGGTVYKTDYSNASRTQLFNIFDLTWDHSLCKIFGIDPADLAQVCDSNSFFGTTTLEGYLDVPVPIHGVLGDSHGALLGQGCIRPGMTKATYGTGSSIMMNIGQAPIWSEHGVVTSIGYGLTGKITYVLEGNINYTGAVITWLKDDVGLLTDPQQTADMCRSAVHNDALYLVPAFTGLGAPYWKSDAQGILCGITRTTGKNEIIRAGVECIAYQITDVIRAMCRDAGIPVTQLRADGGPTANDYLMQFQSDLLQADVRVPPCTVLSGKGAACAAGLGLGIIDIDTWTVNGNTVYQAAMSADEASARYDGWCKAVRMLLS